MINRISNSKTPVGECKTWECDQGRTKDSEKNPWQGPRCHYPVLSLYLGNTIPSDCERHTNSHPTPDALGPLL